MDELKIELTQEALEDPQGTMHALIEAANNICEDSQQDFQALKDTKWYKRLWNIITFSKDNEKKIARGVANIAKLQEIVMKALLYLVGHSAETAEIAKQNSIILDELSNKLAVTKNIQVGIIRELERIKSGIVTSLSFDEISSDIKCIIVNAILAIAEIIPQKTQLGKEYLSAMMRAAHCTLSDIQNGIDFDYMGDFKRKESHLVYSMAMEYVFLTTGGFDCDSEIIKCISISKRNSEAVCMQIKRIVSVLGEESLLNRFENENDYGFIEENFVEWYVEENEMEPEFTVPKIEVMNIDNIVHIAPDATVSYQYKEIHLNSIINCSGILRFDECTIVYNENKKLDEIILNDKAKLYATNCVFKCKDVDEKYFISLSNNCCAFFEKCKFNDCSYFLVSDKENSEISITDCDFYNCEAFIKQGWGDRKFRLTQAKIIMDYNLKYKNTFIDTSLFKIECVDACVKNVNVSWITGRAVRLNLFDICYGTVIDSYFEGTQGEVISASIVENCVFKNCSGSDGLCAYNPLINNLSCYNEEKNIKSCVFENCTRIASVDSNTVITQCKFVCCTDELINSEPGIKISFCEFIKYRSVKKTVSAISLHASKDGNHSVIENCVFDGVDINEGFLISPHIYGKLHGNTIVIRNCDFINCSTKRQSRKIIKSYGIYYNIFSSEKEELAVTIDKCRGLDDVKRVYL